MARATIKGWRENSGERLDLKTNSVAFVYSAVSQQVDILGYI